MLQPKRTKYKKYKKGVLPRLEYRANKLKFGVVGLKSLESGSISARQLEAARQAITRKLKRMGKVWIRVFPNYPVTSKPSEVRMGRGKGAVDHWIVKVGGGTILFEIDGVSQRFAKLSLKAGVAKLPVKTIII
jgi:large subunit ribosomal protein L16